MDDDEDDAALPRPNQISASGSNAIAGSGLNIDVKELE